jgi:hypothetical protein
MLSLSTSARETHSLSTAYFNMVRARVFNVVWARVDRPRYARHYATLTGATRDAINATYGRAFTNFR